ncbi:MAG: zinc-ribbon domain-containing protein [Turicibacter sp.]|nr:zinc-ribbon domain-containing protein [Turicibacter sp.]
MFCTNCGVKNAENVKFCNACGSPMSGDASNVGNFATPSSRQSTQTYANPLATLHPQRIILIVISAAGIISLFLPWTSSVLEFFGITGNSFSISPIAGIIGIIFFSTVAVFAFSVGNDKTLALSEYPNALVIASIIMGGGIIALIGLYLIFVGIPSQVIAEIGFGMTLEDTTISERFEILGNGIFLFTFAGMACWLVLSNHLIRIVYMVSAIFLFLASLATIDFDVFLWMWNIGGILERTLAVLVICLPIFSIVAAVLRAKFNLLRSIAVLGIILVPITAFLPWLWFTPASLFYIALAVIAHIGCNYELR